MQVVKRQSTIINVAVLLSEISASYKFRAEAVGRSFLTPVSLLQDGSGGSGSRLGYGQRDKTGSGNGAAGDHFKPPALTQELLALHNRDMERRMLCKFKEGRRAGEIRFLKDSPKHRLLVTPTGGGVATGGGDTTGAGTNREGLKCFEIFAVSKNIFKLNRGRNALLVKILTMRRNMPLTKFFVKEESEI